MSDIAERVKKIVVEHLGVEADKVIDNANFIDDLGADSLDTVELVMAFEEEFGVEIPDDAAETILTVGDAVKFLEKATAGKLTASAVACRAAIARAGASPALVAFAVGGRVASEGAEERHAPGRRHRPRHGLAAGLRRRADVAAPARRRMRRRRDRRASTSPTSPARSPRQVPRGDGPTARSIPTTGWSRRSSARSTTSSSMRIARRDAGARRRRLGAEDRRGADRAPAC